MKRKRQINRTSVTDIIFLMMSNTGMTQEQAAITVENILSYMKQHTSDPLSKLAKYIFGAAREDQNASLN